MRKIEEMQFICLYEPWRVQDCAKRASFIASKEYCLFYGEKVGVLMSRRKGRGGNTFKEST